MMIDPICTVCTEVKPNTAIVSGAFTLNHRLHFGWRSENRSSFISEETQTHAMNVLIMTANTAFCATTRRTSGQRNGAFCDRYFNKFMTFSSL